MYKKPDFITNHLFNPAVALATKLGLSMRGSRVLSVRGRKSGEWRSTPVNPLMFEGQRYLVAPRGTTQWVRNIRVTNEGVLTLGRKHETIHVEEIPDSAKAPILRSYLKHWASETRKFFGVADANVPDEELERIAPDHPVFRIKGP
ncbi:MAG: nitroreductase/quinone reductase family protein [Tepidiformaceae bacterium]